MEGSMLRRSRRFRPFWRRGDPTAKDGKAVSWLPKTWNSIQTNSSASENSLRRSYLLETIRANVVRERLTFS